MSENLERNTRKNPFCVISKMVYGENPYTFHDIQTNNAWADNPYGEDYVVVPDGMVEDIMGTGGYCDIVLNEDGTEVVSFTAKEKPEPVEPTPPEHTEEEELMEAMNVLLGGDRA